MKYWQVKPQLTPYLHTNPVPSMPSVAAGTGLAQLGR